MKDILNKIYFEIMEAHKERIRLRNKERNDRLDRQAEIQAKRD